MTGFQNGTNIFLNTIEKRNNFMTKPEELDSEKLWEILGEYADNVENWEGTLFLEGLSGPTRRYVELAQGQYHNTQSPK